MQSTTTEAKSTDSRSKERTRIANELYLVLVKASEAGMQAIVGGGWKLDLLDEETGEREPIWSLTEVEK